MRGEIGARVRKGMWENLNTLALLIPVLACSSPVEPTFAIEADSVVRVSYVLYGSPGCELPFRVVGGKVERIEASYEIAGFGTIREVFADEGLAVVMRRGSIRHASTDRYRAVLEVTGTRGESAAHAWRCRD